MAQVQLSIPSSDKKISVNTGLFINNEFVKSLDSQEKITYVQSTTDKITFMANQSTVDATGPSIQQRRKSFAKLRPVGATLALRYFCDADRDRSSASAKDIDRAVAAARTAFKTTWGKNVTGIQRAALLHKLADLIERDQQELAELETLDNGKPVKIAR